MRIAAFDMGTRNFAFCVEEFDDGKEKCVIQPRFDEDGNPDDTYAAQLKQHVFGNGRLIEMKCIDLKAYCETQRISNLYVGVTHLLNAYARLWDAVDVILIEQQMSYGHHKSNIQALRLAQHCLTYFYVVYGTFKTIQEFSSNHKTRVLGCPREERRTHKQRKQFAVRLASQILEERDDPLRSALDARGKQDDVSDCVLMVQAYKVLVRSKGSKRGGGCS